MSPRLMIILTIVIAATAIVLVILAMIRRDGRKPATAAPKYKPRHVATERIHAGGRYLATQPRRDSAPLTEQAIITSRPGRPWDTAANPVLNDDAETLRLGGWNTMPAERIIAAEQLAKGLIA